MKLWHIGYMLGAVALALTGSLAIAVFEWGAAIAFGVIAFSVLR
jgi:hypothetical protein